MGTSSGMVALAIVLVLVHSAFSPAKMAVSTPVTPALPEPQIPSTLFRQERLQTFSGYDFTLFPTLNELLNLWEQQAQPAAEPSAPDVVRHLTEFVNLEFVHFDEYVIRQRDNYWKVAKDHGYTIDTIVGCNPHLEKVVCHVGQRILLPTRGGCLHQVRAGEDLFTIALDYRVPEESIEQANRLSPEWGIVPGMWIFIPGAKPLYLSQGMHQQYSKRSLFRSPLSGRYTSFVGMRIHPVLGFSKYHNGVDIACKPGSWVGAAAGGTVLVAGWGGAIGQYVKINHHNGYMTMYGHLSAIYVHVGQNVKGGQLIARSGSTGRVTGPHLHFTIWENGVVKDPMDFLW